MRLFHYSLFFLSSVALADRNSCLNDSQANIDLSDQFAPPNARAIQPKDAAYCYAYAPRKLVEALAYRIEKKHFLFSTSDLLIRSWLAQNNLESELGKKIQAAEDPTQIPHSWASYGSPAAAVFSFGLKREMLMESAELEYQSQIRHFTEDLLHSKQPLPERAKILQSRLESAHQKTNRQGQLWSYPASLSLRVETLQRIPQQCQRVALENYLRSRLCSEVPLVVTFPLSLLNGEPRKTATPQIPSDLTHISVLKGLHYSESGQGYLVLEDSLPNPKWQSLDPRQSSTQMLPLQFLCQLTQIQSLQQPSEVRQIRQKGVQAPLDVELVLQDFGPREAFAEKIRPAAKVASPLLRR